jgi:hypothetical protein
MEAAINSTFKPVALKTIEGYNFYEYGEIIHFEAA